MITDLANKNISKQLFISTVREELIAYFPNRIFKIVDTSDTRYTEPVLHLPIVFVEINPKSDAIQTVEYTILVNIDRIGNTDVITPDLFIGALSWQLDNLDTITKSFMEKLDGGVTNHVPDFQYVLKYYLENYLDLIKYLREQLPHDFAFGMVNGVTVSPAEIETLIDRIDFDYFLDIDEELVKVLGSKYRLPMNFLKLVNRVYDNHKTEISE
jgi:6-pyruvoyl-tetrahydropterin synthase